MTKRDKAIQAIQQAENFDDRCVAIERAMAAGVSMSVIRELLDQMERGEA